MDQPAFENHPLWTSLTELEALLDAADAQGNAVVGGQFKDLRYVAALLRSHSAPSDTEPYSNAGLGGLNQQLSQAVQELRNYNSNLNPAHVTNAWQAGDQALYQSGMLPVAQLKGGAAAQANKFYKELGETAGKTIKDLHERNAELAAELDEQRNADAQAVAQLKAQVEALTAKVTQDETRLDAALVSNNETFTAKQTEREQKFTEWLAEQGSALKGLADEDLRSIRETRDEAVTVFDEVDKLRDDTKNVAGLAAGDLVAGGYKKFSARQFWTAVAAYVVGFAALAFGAYLVHDAVSRIKPTDAVSWQFTIIKLGLTATALFAAVVAFRVGSHLLAESSTVKRFELELKAIGPLFANDEEEATVVSVKKDLVERSFGQGWRASESSKDVMDEKFIEKVAAIVVRVLKQP